MKDEKIISVCKKYEKDLKELCSSDTDLRHVEWMLVQVPKFIKEKRRKKSTGRKKVNRWLGFIQGVLCIKKICTIEELREHNRDLKKNKLTYK